MWFWPHSYLAFEKKNLNFFAHSITRIVNLPFSHHLPSLLLIHLFSLSLCIVSKVIENVVSAQIGHHLASNCLDKCFQSAYRKNHDTETALLRGQNDILCDLDNKRGYYLFYLTFLPPLTPLTTVFFILRLSTFGVRGSALEWILSYLSDRMQAVNINGCLLVIISSTTLRCPSRICHWPPVLHYIFISNREHCSQAWFTSSHADDTKLYLSFDLYSSSDEIAARSRIESCIKGWQLDALSP